MDFDFQKVLEKALSLIAHPFTAGFFGTLVALRWAPGKSWSDRLLNVVSSMVIVRYGGPALIDFFNIKTESMILFLGFVIGCLGLNFFAKLYEGIKQTEVAVIISSYLKRG